MRSTRIGVGLTAASLAVALGASACSSSKAAPAPKSAPKATVNDINAVPRSELKQGGTLTWPLDQFSTQWNYNEADGPEQSTFDVVSALLPGPFHFDAGGTPSADTDYLAGEPTVTTVAGKQTVTYELNPKAKWSDGTPITEADYAAQWKALNGSNSAYNVASTTGYAQISNVAAGKSQYEVVVTFSSNFADWKSLFSPLYPASTNSTPEAFNKGWLSKIPVTAGPFKFDSFNATDKTVTVVRDPNWWADPAILDKIVYKTVDTAALPDAFASGEIDWFDIGPSASAYKKAVGVSGAKIRVAGGPNFRHLTMNGKSPNLDQNVRQAVAEAIDRGAIAKSDLAGLPWPDKPLNNHFFVNNQNGYQDNAGTVGKYDPTAAKALLQQDGWTQGSGQYLTKNGKPLELKIVIPDGVKVSANEATLIQHFLAQVGIKLDIDAVNSDDFFDKYVNPGQFDLTVFSWIGNDFPVSSNASIYQNPQGTNIFQNFARVGSAGLDAMLTKAQADLDPKQAIADANAVDAQIWQEAGVIPFYQRPDFVAEKATLANFGAFGFADRVYQNIGFTK
ncbi:ABC transporter family substrate-binding protein [Actinocrinis puniceicyclus]|uniref:ABC transporter family substrate-binding protein n=1 Tax=Actinocrinis puniceicyclus TaxID=977794 RepID=A0A8J7WP48_9ACTN|nr:ABC transporter family substrate-binding protein [Actinocrinis puniceicyclus]MBS2963317.1 ABC transporter family substrate-binding protein [Actinocrinis puniceicyclus]